MELKENYLKKWKYEYCVNVNDSSRYGVKEQKI